MNPDLIWDEVKASMADWKREAQHRHLEGEAHRACSVCGTVNDAEAAVCTTCGHRFPKFDPTKIVSDGPTKND
jgi:uncharacterized paraquat-inducible protein A